MSFVYRFLFLYKYIWHHCIYSLWNFPGIFYKLFVLFCFLNYAFFFFKLWSQFEFHFMESKKKVSWRSLCWEECVSRKRSLFSFRVFKYHSMKDTDKYYPAMQSRFGIVSAPKFWCFSQLPIASVSKCTYVLHLSLIYSWLQWLSLSSQLLSQISYLISLIIYTFLINVSYLFNHYHIAFP